MSAPAYLVKGSDPTLRDRVVDDLVAELLGADDRSLALEEITIPGRASAGDDTDAPAGADGRDAAIAALLNAAGSPPFMTEHRVVVTRDVGALTAADVDGIVRYLADPLDTTILVFVAGGGTIPPALTKKLKEIKAEEREPGEREDRQGVGGGGARSRPAPELRRGGSDLDPSRRRRRARGDAGRRPARGARS